MWLFLQLFDKGASVVNFQSEGLFLQLFDKGSSVVNFQSVGSGSGSSVLMVGSSLCFLLMSPMLGALEKAMMVRVKVQLQLARVVWS